jgi:bifunctional non-homologous end joining protein LigD
MPPRLRSRPLAKFIEPCLPRLADRPPIDGDWIHEIKHNGFRIMARRDGRGVRLFTRNGYNFADRFPKIVEAVSNLPALSCLLDGEAVVVDESGLRSSTYCATGTMTMPPCSAPSTGSTLTATTCRAFRSRSGRARWRGF